MSKSDTFENEVLGLFLNGTAIAGLADNAGSGPLANLYVALHTADPGEAGTQATNEVAYTGYARASIARNPGAPAWTISAGAASPNANITWPLCTGGTSTATYFSVGTAAAGAGKILYRGALTSSGAISNNITPQLLTTTAINEG